MKPPMRQKVIIHVPVLDDDGKPIKDKYGKAKTKPEPSKARVQFKSQLIRDTMGEQREVTIEIDLPPKMNPQSGTRIEHVTKQGDIVKGEIIAKEEIINLAGSKVYYRTVYVDGK